MLAANLRCPSRTHQVYEPRVFKARAHCQHWIHCGLDARNARVARPVRGPLTPRWASWERPASFPRGPNATEARDGTSLVSWDVRRGRAAPAIRPGAARPRRPARWVERMLSGRRRRLDSWRQRAPAARPAAVEKAVMDLEGPCRRLPTSGAVKCCRTVPSVENAQHAFDPCEHSVFLRFGRFGKWLRIVCAEQFQPAHSVQYFGDIDQVV